MDSFILILVLLCWGLAIFVLTFQGFHSLKRKRLLIDTPTSKTKGVFIGFVELKGTAEAEQGESFNSFLAGLPSVYSHATVEEHWSRTYTETCFVNGKSTTRTRTESGWKTVSEKQQETLFYLKDETGFIRINPKQAEMDAKIVFSKECSTDDPLYYAKGPADSVSHSTHRRRFIERAIPLHHPIYVLGQSRVRDDLVAAEIAYDPNVSTFLISTQTETELQSSNNFQTLFGFILASLLLAGPIAYFGDNIYTGLLSGIIYWSCCGIGWFIVIYNSLIRLNNRVQQAWSNVDVELKRRAELIPNLVQVVKAMKEHEEETNRIITQLRMQEKVSAPNKTDNSPQAIVPFILGVAEKYPELKANDLFLNLQENLIHSEERIALARNYYNDSVEAFRNRREMFPDSGVALLLNLPTHQYITADHFEINPISLSFEQ